MQRADATAGIGKSVGSRREVRTPTSSPKKAAWGRQSTSSPTGSCCERGRGASSYLLCLPKTRAEGLPCLRTSFSPALATTRWEPRPTAAAGSSVLKPKDFGFLLPSKTSTRPESQYPALPRPVPNDARQRRQPDGRGTGRDRPQALFFFSRGTSPGMGMKGTDRISVSRLSPRSPAAPLRESCPPSAISVLNSGKREESV